MTAYGDTTNSTPAIIPWGLAPDPWLVAWTGGGGLGGAEPNWRLNTAVVSGDGPLVDRALVGEETSREGLALAKFNGQTYLAWTGMDGASSVNIVPSADGVNWRTAEKRWPLGQALGGPALTAYDGRLYLAFTGLDEHLYLTSTADGSNFSAPQRLGDQRGIAASPSMVVYTDPSTGQEELHVAWTQSGTFRLCDATLTVDGGGNLTGLKTLELDWTTSNGPALLGGWGLSVVWIAASGPQRMYSATRDLGDDDWITKPVPSGDTTPFPPALAEGDDIVVAWSGGGGLGSAAPNYRLNIALAGEVFPAGDLARRRPTRTA